MAGIEWKCVAACLLLAVYQRQHLTAQHDRLHRRAQHRVRCEGYPVQHERLVLPWLVYLQGHLLAPLPGNFYMAFRNLCHLDGREAVAGLTAVAETSSGT